MIYKSMTIQDILNRTKDFDQNDPNVTLQEFGLTYIVKCFVCNDEELAVKAKLPDGWKIVKKYNYTLCPECAKKLREWVKNGQRIKTAV